MAIGGGVLQAPNIVCLRLQSVNAEMSDGFKLRHYREPPLPLRHSLNLPLRIAVMNSLEFPHKFAFANFSIIHVRFASAILESLSFPVYVCEWVCVRVIVHDVSPLTRILRLVYGHEIQASLKWRHNHRRGRSGSSRCAAVREEDRRGGQGSPETCRPMLPQAPAVTHVCESGSAATS